MDPLIQKLIALGMSPYEAFEYVRKKGLAKAKDQSDASAPGNIAPYLSDKQWVANRQQQDSSRAYERRMYMAGNHKYGGMSGEWLTERAHPGDFAEQSPDPWDSPTNRIRHMLTSEEVLQIMKAKFAAAPAAGPAFQPAPIPQSPVGKELNTGPTLNKLAALRDLAAAKANEILGDKNILEEMNKRKK